MFYNNALDTQELMQRIANDLIDSYDEELELEIEDREVDDIGAPQPWRQAWRASNTSRTFSSLQGELVKLQDWVQHSRQKVVILFEGRDAAGKGRRHQTHHAAPEPPCGPGGGTARTQRPRAHAVVLSALCSAPACGGRDGAV